MANKRIGKRTWMYTGGVGVSAGAAAVIDEMMQEGLQRVMITAAEALMNPFQREETVSCITRTVTLEMPGAAKGGATG